MKEVTFEDYRARMLRVLVYLQQHLDETLSLDALAEVAHFSPFHFHRIFRGLVGESVKEHVRRLRLERSAHRLRHTGQPVTEIALGAGYESLEAFSRAFHKLFGQPPRDYRLLRRVAAYGPASSGVHYVADGSLDDFLPAPNIAAPLVVRIEPLPEMLVAFIRHVGPYEHTDAAYAQLLAWAGRRGLLRAETQVFRPRGDENIAVEDSQLVFAAPAGVDRHVIDVGVVHHRCERLLHVFIGEFAGQMKPLSASSSSAFRLSVCPCSPVSRERERACVTPS